MNKLVLVLIAFLIVIPADLYAQRGGRGGRGGGGGGGGGAGGSSKGDAPTSRPEKATGDLAASSISGTWKDAKTLVVTATIKNPNKTPYSGQRTVTLSVTFKDGRSESLSSETIIGIDGGETHTLTFEATDKKYFDKEAKWTIEISAGDTTSSNDKKTTKLTLSPQPKS